MVRERATEAVIAAAYAWREAWQGVTDAELRRAPGQVIAANLEIFSAAEKSLRDALAALDLAA